MPGTADGDETVSYTHLDVYKRQELEFELPTPISKERAMEVAVEQYGFCPDPVSYTHLDVYKRQTWEHGV